MTFSERHGYAEVRTIAQLESMDDKLRMALWNTLYGLYFADWNEFESHGSRLTRAVWTELLHGDLALVPESPAAAGGHFRQLVLKGEWHVVYDLLELALANSFYREDLTETLNTVLSRHLAGYRMVHGKAAPVTDSAEVAEVTTALALPEEFAAARGHLDTALALFSDREDPNYANSIKESISAVESMVLVVTGKKGFHGAVDTLEKSYGMHSKLVLSWKYLYGFTSDEAGVRHGGPNPPAVTQPMARYFLISCSAFVNLLASMAE